MVNKTGSASNWNLHWDPKAPIRPSPYGATWRFDFYPKVGYVTRGSGGSILPYSKMRLSYKITGTGVLAPSEGSPPPRLAFYFQRKDDDWQGTVGGTETYRWYSNLRTPLVLGETNIEVPLTGDAWKSVRTVTGIMSPTKFKLAKTECVRIGFTFGGTGNAGHGVQTSPGDNCYFQLLDFRLE